MPRLSIAAGCALLADAAVAPGAERPAVWIDWPEDAARSDGWLAAVPAGAVEVGSVVPAGARAGRSGGMQDVVVAEPRAAMAASRDALLVAADALPAGMVDWPGAPVESRDDPAEPRDDRDARRGGWEVRRGAPAGCREALAGRAERPGGQAARLHRDGRDVGPEDVCQADPDERREGDPVHPDAMRREAA